MGGIAKWQERQKRRAAGQLAAEAEANRIPSAAEAIKRGEAADLADFSDEEMRLLQEYLDGDGYVQPECGARNGVPRRF